MISLLVFVFLFRGMEQKMIKHYKDAKKSELVFVKNPKPKAEGGNKAHLKTRGGAPVGYGQLGNWGRNRGGQGGGQGETSRPQRATAAAQPAQAPGKTGIP